MRNDRHEATHTTFQLSFGFAEVKIAYTSVLLRNFSYKSVRFEAYEAFYTLNGEESVLCIFTSGQVDYVQTSLTSPWYVVERPSWAFQLFHPQKHHHCEDYWRMKTVGSWV